MGGGDSGGAGSWAASARFSSRTRPTPATAGTTRAEALLESSRGGAQGFVWQRVARGRAHALRQRQRGPVLRPAVLRVFCHLTARQEQEERDEAKANGNAQKNMETWRRGERPNITGDAGQRMSELGMTRAFVAQMEGARHAMCDTHDLALYRLLAEFLAKPEECASIAERWAEDGQMKEYVLWRAKIVKDKSAFAAMASSDEVAWRRSERKEGSGRGGSRRRGRLFHPSASSFLDLTSSFASWSPRSSGRRRRARRAREAPWRISPPRRPERGARETQSQAFLGGRPGNGRAAVGGGGTLGRDDRNGQKTLGLFDDRSDVVPKPDNPRKISVDDDGTFRRMPSPLPPRAMPSPPPSPPRAMPKASKKSSSSKNCCVM